MIKGLQPYAEYKESRLPVAHPVPSTPTAFRHAAQGCACHAVAKRRREARATLGLSAERGQPQPGCVGPRTSVRGRNPVGVVTVWGMIPRVAPQTAQPWAERRNPVGIQNRASKGATA